MCDSGKMRWCEMNTLLSGPMGGTHSNIMASDKKMTSTTFLQIYHIFKLRPKEKKRNPQTHHIWPKEKKNPQTPLRPMEKKETHKHTKYRQILNCREWSDLCFLCFLHNIWHISFWWWFRIYDNNTVQWTDPTTFVHWRQCKISLENCVCIFWNDATFSHQLHPFRI